MAIPDQPWEDVASDVTDAIEKAVQPLIKKAVDDIYGGLLDTTQDYRKDNLAFNIASRIGAAEREASDARQKLSKALAAISDLQEELALTLEELIDHNGDSMDDTRRKRVDQLRARHWSDCAVHNEPAMAAGACDCGGYFASLAISRATGSPQ